jgi:hypothetical protein
MIGTYPNIVSLSHGPILVLGDVDISFFFFSIAFLHIIYLVYSLSDLVC